MADDGDQEIVEAVVTALTEGQGGFSEAELGVAVAYVNDCLTQGAIAELVLDGDAALHVKDGEVEVEALVSDAADDPEAPGPRGMTHRPPRRRRRRRPS